MASVEPEPPAAFDAAQMLGYLAEVDELLVQAGTPDALHLYVAGGAVIAAKTGSRLTGDVDVVSEGMTPDETTETTGSVEGSTGKELSLFSMALWGPDGPAEDVFGRDDCVSCPEDDGHDDDCWGHVSPIRQPVAIPPPIMLPSQSEMRRIALGHRPVWDDKWLAFCDLYPGEAQTGSDETRLARSVASNAERESGLC